MDFLAVGCWGVYGDEGKKIIIKKKEKKGKTQIESKPVIRGQQSVANIINHIIQEEKHSVKNLFLAGDNIYQKSLEEELQEKYFPFKEEKQSQSSLQEEKEKFLKDYIPSSNINEQIEKGFNLFKHPNIDNYYVIAGNHDVEDCGILEKEINNKSWEFPSIFYSVLYNLESYNVHVMFIDTNIFEYMEDGEGEKNMCDFKIITCYNVQEIYDNILQHVNSEDLIFLKGIYGIFNSVLYFIEIG
jgi:hypothetical protein